MAARTAHITKAQRLMIIIGISFSFFLAEIAVGFYTRSLALVADAFHYLNDLVGFIVALVAFKISERNDAPKELSFGWQRANLLGAFFNGVFLLALGVSIFLQSVERFVSPQVVDNPFLVLIIGCVGFALNVISAVFLHEHDEDVKRVVEGGHHLSDVSAEDDTRVNPHGEHIHETQQQDIGKKAYKDFGMMGVLIHVIGDAANNVGVIIAASLMWKLDSPGRFYADPAISMAIAFMIFLTSLPLVRKTGEILMESSPIGVNPRDVKHDVERIEGVKSVHELHIWRLNQQKSIASAHIIVTDQPLSSFMKLAKTVNECFHAYGIHSSTLQPELALVEDAMPLNETSIGGGQSDDVEDGLRQRIAASPNCRIGCTTTDCEDLACCS
ncbi:cation efflux protein [Xylariales sp. PMI_506]|nr:cation efflux protein [Xylariales sp. PMI_506]